MLTKGSWSLAQNHTVLLAAMGTVVDSVSSDGQVSESEAVAGWQ